MKYGLLYYKDTDNIGDDIQSYAASRFLPRIDYLVDREDLEGFVPNKKEKVKVIMNAWYIHDKFNFDISPYIDPLHISIFLKKYPYEAGITIGSDYINDNVISNYRKYGPVGTRDLHTKKLLDKLNVDNYFSGCMTLTINKFDDVKKEDYIVTVGLTDEEISYIKSRTNRKVIKFIQDVKKGSFSNEAWEERRKRVEKTLRLYQGAHMVITNKLHCSLPCLALGTPVLLLYDRSFSENKDRIGTFLPYLNHINREDLTSKNIDFEKPKENPTKYLELRKNLEDKCYKFVEEKPISEKLPEISQYLDYIKRSRVMRILPITQLEKLQKTYEKECLKSSKMYDELEKYEELKVKYREVCYKYKRYEKFDNFLRKVINTIRHK